MTRSKGSDRRYSVRESVAGKSGIGGFETRHLALRALSFCDFRGKPNFEPILIGF